MNVEDLWIGESLRLKKSGRIGRYAGPAANGRIRVKLTSKTVLTKIENVELYEEKHEPKLDFTEPPTPVKKKFSGPELDLHIEVLNPKLLGAPAGRILDHQISTAKDYLAYAYEQHWLTVKLIHGKGEGVLKSEIHHILSQLDYVKIYHVIHDGGATEVWLHTTHRS